MIDPNEDFCRKLCEEVGLVSRPYAEEYHGVEEWAVESAMSAISKAIQIVMEKAARSLCKHCLGSEDAEREVYWTEAKYVCNFGPIPSGFVHKGKWNECLPCDASAIRSLQLSAEDVRTEGK